MNERQEVTASFACAEFAFEKIKQFKIAATPRNYELLYSYACGTSPSIRSQLDRLFEIENVTQRDLDKMYANQFDSGDIAEQMRDFGMRVHDRVEQFTRTIERAAASTEHTGECLFEAGELLRGKNDRTAISKIVEGLISAASTMKAVNQSLQAELNDSHSAISELRSNIDAAQAESMLDPLTQVPNRKSFDRALNAAIVDARESEYFLSLLMIDVDDFKAFNDRFGHRTGDQVLQLVAHVLRQNVRGQDVAARFGGEEFAVILPRTALGVASLTVAKGLRTAIEAKQLVRRSDGEHLGNITVSIGVASLNSVDTAESLLARADAALYTAKRSGRNRVVAEAG